MPYIPDIVIAYATLPQKQTQYAPKCERVLNLNVLTLPGRIALACFMCGRLFKFLEHAAVHTAHVHHTIVVGGKRWLVAALRKGYAAKIAHYSTTLRWLEFPQMCVAVGEYVVFQRGTVLLVVHVAVGKEHSAAAVNNKGVVCHYRKVEKHLVHLGVAVAAHGNNAVLTGVEQLDDALRIDALWYAVARAVVEYVAENTQHIIVAAIVEGKHLLKGGQAAVNV